MKLYSSVKSERATKNQGGNKYLDIDLAVGSRDDSHYFANVRLNIPENTGNYTLWIDNVIIKEWDEDFNDVTKGKKQTSEKPLFNESPQSYMNDDIYWK